MGLFDLLLGPILVSTVIAGVFYGILLLQCYTYYVHFRSDKARIKLVVMLVLLCNTVGMILYLCMIYNYFVTDFGNLEALALANVGVLSHPVSESVTAAVVQFFYAWRIYILTGKRWLTCLICVSTAVTLLAGIGVTIGGTIVKELAMIATDLRAICLTWGISSVVTDVLITISLVWHLHKRRTGFAATDGIVGRLICVTIQTGLVTTTAVVGTLIAYVASDSTIYFGIGIVASKLYGNTLLSTLTMRSAWGLSDIANSGGTNSSAIPVNLRNPNAPISPRTERVCMVPLSPFKQESLSQARDDEYNVGMGGDFKAEM